VHFPPNGGRELVYELTYRDGSGHKALVCADLWFNLPHQPGVGGLLGKACCGAVAIVLLFPQVAPQEDEEGGKHRGAEKQKSEERGGRGEARTPRTQMRSAFSKMSV